MCEKQELKIRIGSGSDTPLLVGDGTYGAYVVLDLATGTVYTETDLNRVSLLDDVQTYRVFRFEVNNKITLHALVGLVVKFKERLLQIVQVTKCKDDPSAASGGVWANRGVVITVGEDEWLDLIHSLRSDIEKSSYNRGGEAIVASRFN